MQMIVDDELDAEIRALAVRALDEDVGSGDLTASLIPIDLAAHGRILTREPITLAGAPWVDAIYRQLDKRISIEWHRSDGETAGPGDTLCTLAGPARSLLTGERAALNLLQTLSATATETARYVNAVAGTTCQILDTRKTLPGLRLAQKYAVRCGGGNNHRVGLYDAILIKENHIASAGSIRAAVNAARTGHPGVSIEVEVENIDELKLAHSAGVERVLLDNFTLDDTRDAVRINRSQEHPAALEASGNITLDNVRELALTGVDFISIGALTKNVHAIDLTMLLAD